MSTGKANDPKRQIHFGPRLQKRRNSARFPLISPTKKWQNVPVLVTGVEGNQMILVKASGQMYDEAGFHVLSEAGVHCTRGRFSRTDEGRCLPKIGAGFHDTLFCQKHNRLLTDALTVWLSSDGFSRACKETVRRKERETRLELATACLEGRNSTTELLPQDRGARTRTADLLVPNQARYQLRHTPMTY